jgi:hypothetical protein
MRNLTLIFALALSASAAPTQESQIHADFRGEAARFKQSCEGFTFKKIPGCADLLFTDHPLHIAVGSIAPQNGFGAGGAYVGHYTPNELWRTSTPTRSLPITAPGVPVSISKPSTRPSKKSKSSPPPAASLRTPT